MNPYGLSSTEFKLRIVNLINLSIMITSFVLSLINVLQLSLFYKRNNKRYKMASIVCLLIISVSCVAQSCRLHMVIAWVFSSNPGDSGDLSYIFNPIYFVGRTFYMFELIRFPYVISSQSDQAFLRSPFCLSAVRNLKLYTRVFYGCTLLLAAFLAVFSVLDGDAVSIVFMVALTAISLYALYFQLSGSVKYTKQALQKQRNQVKIHIFVVATGAVQQLITIVWNVIAFYYTVVLCEGRCQQVMAFAQQCQLWSIYMCGLIIAEGINLMVAAQIKQLTQSQVSQGVSYK